MSNNFDYRKINHIHYASIWRIKDRRRVPSLFSIFLLYLGRIVYFSFLGSWKYVSVKNVLFIATSKNTQRSLEPIANALKNRDYTFCTSLHQILPYARVYWYSLLWFPSFLKLYFSSTKDEKKMIRSTYSYFLSAPGIVKVASIFFRKNSHIKVTVFANDHTSPIRSVIQAAKDCSISTLYTQHASVTKLFPPLIFDYNFLDGKESFEKYLDCGKITGSVFLSGSPRFDYICNIQEKERNSIGIAFNILDDVKKVYKTCSFLVDHKFTIEVRPHPRQRGIDWKPFKELGISISNPVAESPFDFLNRQRCIIAGSSSIHLDSALMRVPSIIYNWTNGSLRDSYGYCVNNLVLSVNSDDELVDILHNISLQPKELVQYYVSSFGTSFQGKTSLLIAGFIDALVDNQLQFYIDKNFKYHQDNYFTIK